jgi:hypothetical protein
MEIGPWFAGGLDEVRIYRRALSAAEIAADMARPIDSRQSMISSIAPGAGPVGQTVSISGVNFRATQGTSVVTFNGVSASVSAWADGVISAAVPSGAHIRSGCRHEAGRSEQRHSLCRDRSSDIRQSVPAAERIGMEQQQRDGDVYLYRDEMRQCRSAPRRGRSRLAAPESKSPARRSIKTA